MNANPRTAHFPGLSLISLQTRDVPVLQEFKVFAHRRLSSSLGRFGQRIATISIWLEDVNGPRGGVDKRCRIEVQLRPRGRFLVSAVAANEYLCLARGAEKARTTLDRVLKQRRTKQRTRTKAFHRLVSVDGSLE